MKIWEIFKNALTWSMFELQKCIFFKWVRILPEIDWYHYQCASPAPMCILWHQKLIWSEVSHQSPVCPPHVSSKPPAQQWVLTSVQFNLIYCCCAGGNIVSFCLTKINIDICKVMERMHLCIKGAHESSKIYLKIDFFHENLLGNNI